MPLTINELWMQNVHRTKKKRFLRQPARAAIPAQYHQTDRMDRTGKTKSTKILVRKGRPSEAPVYEDVDQIVESGQRLTTAKPPGDSKAVAQIVDENGTIMNEFLADDMPTARALADAYVAQSSGA